MNLSLEYGVLMSKLLETFRRHRFLFSELVKRDFKKKYKRTYLGMLWSLLSPLLTLFVMNFVFSHFFGRSNEYYDYTIYLFCGIIVWSFFSDATNGGMTSLLGNAAIFSKINVPKYLFLFSKNVSSLINFGLTFVVFIVFCLFRQVPVTPLFFGLIIPILCLIVFNLGIGMILSALYLFFRDIQYLWSVFLTLLMYLTAIFYDPHQLGGIGEYAWVFNLNPVYVYVSYFRYLVLGSNGAPPSFPPFWVTLLAVGYAAAAFLIGALIYKRKNHKFLYYI